MVRLSRVRRHQDFRHRTFQIWIWTPTTLHIDPKSVLTIQPTLDRLLPRRRSSRTSTLSIIQCVRDQSISTNIERGFNQSLFPIRPHKLVHIQLSPRQLHRLPTKSRDLRMNQQYDKIDFHGKDWLKAPYCFVNLVGKTVCCPALAQQEK